MDAPTPPKAQGEAAGRDEPVNRDGLSGQIDGPEKNSRGNMLKGSVFWSMILFALPIVVGNFFLQLYVIVDAIIVGRFIGARSLAAVSVATPISSIVVFFLFGGCTGVSVLVAQTYGGGDRRKLREAISTSLIFGVAFTFFLTWLCIAFTPSVLRWTRTPPELCEETTLYLDVVFWGLIFSFLYNFFASALRGIGNSRAPFLIQAAASCLHIAMNLFFVGYAGMGIRGSALATVLSQVFSSLVCVVYVYRREPLLALHRGDWHLSAAMLKLTLNYSWASALQSVIVYVGRFLTQGCINPLGADNVAGYNAATRVENIVMMTYDGVNVALSTFIAQNLGARQSGRIASGFFTAMAADVGYIAVAGALLFWKAPAIMGIFVSGAASPGIIDAGVQYLRPMACYLTISVFVALFQSTLRGLGKFRIIMTVSLVQIAIRVFLSFRLVPVLGIPATAHSTAVGWLAVLIWIAPPVCRRLKEFSRGGEAE
ncbi:MAG: MATE family efflux transporter [Pyramidobacter sp.]|jgi:putative MATE family efflux protein